MAKTCAAWIPPGVALALITLTTVTLTASSEAAPGAGTRADGVRLGTFAVGFERRIAVDPARRINDVDEGTKVGLAIWYPADASAAAPRLTSLDYRLLEFSTPPSDAVRRAYEEREIDALLAYRHISIVALTREQARATLHAAGIAVKDARPVSRRSPVVMLLGGAYYLSTTAEVLASHGFLVVAPFRFSDQSNEIAAKDFVYSWFVENSVRDAEFALTAMRRDARADTSVVSTIGHGGGGIHAMMCAMRNRHVAATVNIDAGNFSNRSRSRDLPFYSPRLMRAPYLYIATAATRRSQDLFEDFQGMTFSDRYEVVLERASVRHHDLSDIGRAVTAPLALRGEPAADVQQSYAEVHEMVVRFLLAHVGRADERRRYRDWLAARQKAGAYTVSIQAGTQPAPTVARVLETLDAATAAALRDARRRDPDAPVFQPDALLRIASYALAARLFDAAEGVSALGAEIHPASPLFPDARSQALEARGDIPQAIDAARACAAMPAGDDWRAIGAVNRCRDRLARLTATRSPQ